MKKLFSLVAIALVGTGAWYAWTSRHVTPEPWTADEIELIRSLWIGSLSPLPEDESNAVSDSEEAARLGYQLFFDPRLSGNGGISCATCHQPERQFTDGLPKGQAIGTSRRNTRSIIGVAYSPWLYWDGRKDSLWSQALAPLEDPNEHGTDRVHVVSVIAADPGYRATYESLFSAAPDEHDVDRAFTNIGKVIAAYERLLLPGPSRFDHYVEAIMTGRETSAPILGDDEIHGLRLFIGKADCTQCHNGPLFTNHEFHNTGVLSFPGDVPDKGRVQGVREVFADPFNCRGEFSDDPAPSCAELEFVRTGPELIGAVRTPSLRNLQTTAPYMHKGQLPTLAAVLEHYNEAPLAMIGHNESKPLGLNQRELRQLEAFLDALAAPLATDEKWLRRP